MAVTLNDVAKKAGVSASTVSRVISGKEKISDKTKEKIFSIMKELDYHPNSQARNLATGSSQTIGLVINANEKDFYSNIFFSSSVFGIEKIAQDNSYNLIITNNQKKRNDKASIDTLLFEKKVDGIILPPLLLTKTLITKLKNNKIPFVVLGEPNYFKDKISWVDINNTKGSNLATSHLYNKGYKQIAFLGGSENEIFTKNRIIGYKNSLNNQEPLIFNTENSEESITQAATEILKNKKVDSVICNDNITALLLSKAAKEQNVHIPQDLGIITFDDYPLSKYISPSLTSIVTDTYTQGEMAANMLFSLIQGKTAITHSLIDVSLIERESSMRNL
ncbi:MAG: LacI family DNA-binding transcriptional regulator [Pleomorphochaeta sp.]